MTKIVLLDRDGCVIVDPPSERVTSEDEIKLFPDSLSALKLLADNGFQAIMITNQAGISEGRITEDEFTRINTEVIRRLEESGIKFIKTYMCPHIDKDRCNCRKPLPTMVLDAIKDFDLDPSATFMVGDHRSDVLAAQSAGCKGILVETANHPDESPEAEYTAQTLTEAVEYIIKNT